MCYHFGEDDTFMKPKPVFIVTCLLVASVVVGLAMRGQPPAGEPPRTDAEITPTDAEIKRLITALGDESFRVREDATKRLIEIGMPAFEPLLEAKRKVEPETWRRAEAIIDAIGVANRFVIVDDMMFRLTSDKKWIISRKQQETIKVSLEITNLSDTPRDLNDNALLFGVVTDKRGRELSRELDREHPYKECYSTTLKKNEMAVISFKGRAPWTSGRVCDLIFRDDFGRTWRCDSLPGGDYFLKLVYDNRLFVRQGSRGGHGWEHIATTPSEVIRIIVETEKE